MFQVDRLKARIQIDEGFRSEPYLDTLDHWTIGYGSTFINGNPVNAFTTPIKRKEAAHLMQADILDAIQSCQFIYQDVFPALHSVHQEVLICLAYQLGRHGLSRFKRMNYAIDHLNYGDWMKELKDSKLYTQATNRVTRYLTAIETAQWSDLSSNIQGDT